MKLISADMNDICQNPWKYAVDPFHIMGRLYYVGNSWVGVYLVDTGEGLLLIDTAMAQTVYLTFEGIRILGFDPHDIKWILLSHAHYDHCGGAAVISHYSGAEIWLGREDHFFLTERNDLIHTALNGPFQPFHVDHPYVSGEPMCFGEFTITAVHCPGHTPGTYSFFFDLEENGKMYKAAMHGGLGVNTVTTEYLTSHGLSLGLQDDFVRNLREMHKRKVDVPIGSHTNHGDMLGKAAKLKEKDGENPFIDRLGFQQVMESRLADFHRAVPEYQMQSEYFRSIL